MFNIYTPCQPEHGIGDDKSFDQAKLAVESRAYPIFRYDPEEDWIEVRPLVELTGRAMFNEVFIEEARVPAENIIGGLNNGWAVANTKLIAEAWDAAGLYQVGHFIGDSWKEWNGRFRDDIRSFFRGDEKTVTTLPARLLGSPDLYSHRLREPEQSVNFVTCHDGFTLNDLVSYNEKHNEANGEDNRDGTNDNDSWNCGWEGPTDDPGINALRMRQIGRRADQFYRARNRETVCRDARATLDSDREFSG